MGRAVNNEDEEFEMNLSSLSDKDLDLLFSAIESANSDAASEVYDAIMEETERRKAGKHESRTGYRIEFRKSYGKWVDAKESYFGFVYAINRFFPSKEAAQVAVAKLNDRIKARDYEGWKTVLKAADVRFVKITTTHEIV